MQNYLPSAAILALLGPGIALTAHAEIYMNDQQAVQNIFPGAVMQKSEITLTPEEIAQIEKTSDQNVRNKTLTVWKDKNKNFVYIDQALGKHEFITYAVGMTADKKVKAIEILEYRETYGQKVREADWRNQFVGKDQSSPVKLGKDIKNISGATLSSAHITGGVRRIIFTHDTIVNRL